MGFPGADARAQAKGPLPRDVGDWTPQHWPPKPGRSRGDTERPGYGEKRLATAGRTKDHGDTCLRQQRRNQPLPRRTVLKSTIRTKADPPRGELFGLPFLMGGWLLNHQ